MVSFQTNTLSNFKYYADLPAQFPPTPARYQDLILAEDWFMGGKKRVKKKVPGQMKMADMSRMIAELWGTTTDEILSYVSNVAYIVKNRRDALKHQMGFTDVCANQLLRETLQTPPPSPALTNDESLQDEEEESQDTEEEEEEDSEEDEDSEEEEEQEEEVKDDLIGFWASAAQNILEILQTDDSRVVVSSDEDR